MVAHMGDLICPRCTTASLAERERDGVTIDVCSECRGVWLDRGELEKLIARATRDIEQLERGKRERERDDDDHDDDDGDRRGGRKRKRSWFEAFDIFD